MELHGDIYTTVDMRSGLLKLVIALFIRDYAALLNAEPHFLDHPEPKNSYGPRSYCGLRTGFYTPVVHHREFRCNPRDADCTKIAQKTILSSQRTLILAHALNSTNDVQPSLS